MAGEYVFYTPDDDARIAEVVLRVLKQHVNPSHERKPLRRIARGEYYEGKPVDNIAKGEWGEIEVWSGDIGEEDVSETTIEVFNRYSDVTPDDWCTVVWFNGTWRIMQSEGDATCKGVLDESLTQTGTATLSVWEYNTEDEVEEDSGDNIEVSGWLLQTGFEFSSGDHVIAKRIGGRWYVLNSRECPEES